MAPPRLSPATDEIRPRALVLGFLGPPLVWALHLAVSYFLVALDCNTGWNGGTTAVLLATAVGAAAALGAGAFAWRGWKRIRGSLVPGELLDPMRIRGFLTLSGVLMAVLFAGAIILAGVSPLFLPLCSPS
jgi:hypothetical protein